MEFASPLAYINPDESDSGSDDLGIEQNFRSNYQRAQSLAAAPRRRRPAPPNLKKKKKHTRVGADTNVVCLKLGSLTDKADVFVGDPVVCSNNHCQGIFSLASNLYDPNAPKIVVESEDKQGEKKAEANVENKGAEKIPEKLPDLEEGQVFWKCEYCGNMNVIDEMDEGEIPTKETYDYVVEPAPENKDGQASGSDRPVIFCIDTSGSMCVTTEVQGNFKLKGAPQNAQDEFGADMSAEFRAEIAYQRRQRQRVSYVSRLQCVQAAVTSQIEDWKQKNPDKKVSLVTFGEDVVIVGDGSSDPVVIAGDKLVDQNTLIGIGTEHAPSTGVAQSSEVITKQVWALAPSGPTALGPALTVCVAMAAKAPGTQVVLCTDGLANVGLGALDTKDEDKKAEVEAWYDGMGRLAAAHGTNINVISIKGSECALEDLGRVCELTGGDVNRVDPLELSKNFATVLSNPVIATNVSCRFLLHNALNFRNEENVKNILVRDLGNVTATTELTFEFAPGDKLKDYPELSEVPFQLQVRFSHLNGMKLQRVISRTLKITHERKDAEKAARVDILSANAIQQTARFAERGMYRHARKSNIRAARLLTRTAVSHGKQDQQIVDMWAQDAGRYDQMCAQQDQDVRSQLRAQGWAANDLDSASEEDDDEVDAHAAQVRSANFAKRKAVRKKAAKSVRSDEMYHHMHSSSRARSSNYTPVMMRPTSQPKPQQQKQQEHQSPMRSGRSALPRSVIQRRSKISIRKKSRSPPS